MKRAILLTILILFLAGAALGGAFFYEFYLRRPAPSAGAADFTVPEGVGVKEISQSLYKTGLIKSSFIFESYVWLKKADKSFRAGKYKIAPGLSMRELTRLLITGGGKEEASITILEGWALRDIKKYLISQGVSEMEKFDYFAGRSAATNSSFDWAQDFSFLSDKPNNLGLEGYLFPDTYRIFKESNAEDAIRKMLQNFDRKFNKELRAQALKKGMTIFEVVNLASIVEREVRREEDMKKVADIFLRRLRLGMALQADSTVNYVTGKDTPAISNEDKILDSPWNTYKYRGLPKGPIGNPGLSSMRAVLYPDANPYLYFLTTKEGEVIYSVTLEEHNRAKAKYLK